MRALVVDDEKPAREELVWLVAQCDGVDVIGQADNAKAALERLELGDIDLVFLDVNMPGISGMRLAELLNDDPEAPQVIFVTAYDQHAVEAFGVDATDYLLKPVRLERLQKALERARERAPAATAAKYLSRISVEQRGVYRVIPADEILFFESEDGIVVVQTRAGERFITDFSLKSLEENLDPELFYRSHRSYIVRLDTIKSIAPWGAGTYQLTLEATDSPTVPLARKRVADLKALIPWSANALD